MRIDRPSGEVRHSNTHPFGSLDSRHADLLFVVDDEIAYPMLLPSRPVPLTGRFWCFIRASAHER